MTKNKHKIEKVFIEIDTNSMQVANSIKNNISMFIQKEILGLLEEEFDTLLSNSNDVIQLDKFSLSLDNIDLNNLNISVNELKNQIKKQIEIIAHLSDNNKSLSSKQQQINHTKINQKEKKTNTLIYFLTYGKMPWWISKNDDSIFTNQNLIEITTDLKYKVETLLNDTTIQKRIINQFNNNQIAILISSRVKDNNLIINKLNTENFEFKVLFWKTIFNYIKTEKTKLLVELFMKVSKNWKLNLDEFTTHIKDIFPVNFTPIQIEELKKEKLINNELKSKPNPIEKSVNDELNLTKEQIKEWVEKENILEEISEIKPIDKSFYVENAGLILLHPFIKELFKKCNLIDENNGIIDKELAVHLLHFAATKKENDYEHTMLFEKFLCGIPLQYSIRRELKIEKKYKQNVEEMLLAVVQHWSALKNSSIDLLRSEFLQREGIIDFSEDNPKLFIEKKTQDILLDKIPWNISTVKIPWMDKLIYTQW